MLPPPDPFVLVFVLPQPVRISRFVASKKAPKKNAVRVDIDVRINPGAVNPRQLLLAS
jgi:hypothetical protein